jgi:hypothetical protein
VWGRAPRRGALGWGKRTTGPEQRGRGAPYHWGPRSHAATLGRAPPPALRPRPCGPAGAAAARPILAQPSVLPRAHTNTHTHHTHTHTHTRTQSHTQSHTTPLHPSLPGTCCACTTLAACSWTAATTRGWQCPVDVTPMPAAAGGRRRRRRAAGGGGSGRGARFRRRSRGSRRAAALRLFSTLLPPGCASGRPLPRRIRRSRAARGEGMGRGRGRTRGHVEVSAAGAAIQPAALAVRNEDVLRPGGRRGRRGVVGGARPLVGRAAPRGRAGCRSPRRVPAGASRRRPPAL